MEELPGRRERSNRDSSRRRLQTPDREDRSRSRSGLRMRSPNPSRHERDFLLGQQRVEMLEQELRRERERLRATEDRRRSSSRRASEHHEPSGRRAVEHRAELRASERRQPSERRKAERRPEPRAEQRGNAGEYKRSRSPSFSKNDLVNVLKLLKEDLSSQPHNQNAKSSQKVDHQNILPNFDPSTKNQRIDIWLKKVNECASVYGWNDRTTTHFAMQKLQGLAKMWYESLNSILFSWKEWQDKLLNAFPCEQNYGQTLEDMLKRKSKFNEPIELYYYEKLALVNQCDIVGKRAVDCIIHGLSDRTLRSSALALRCNHPDQLLQFLLSNKDIHQSSVDRGHFRNKPVDHTQNTNQNQAPKSIARSSQPNGCYNCKEKGHSFLHCPKPLLKCQRCNKIGHTVETCFSKTGEKPTNSSTTVSKTMRIDSVKKGTETANSKFIKEVIVNGVSLQGFIDFGSEVTLIKESITKELGLIHDNTSSQMKGFGNSVVQSLGELSLDLSIDNVNARVICKVVSDDFLEKPLLIGQTYTELSHIVAYKNVSELKFFDNGNKLPFSDVDIESENSFKVRTLGAVKFWGPVSIRASVEPTISGSILLKNSVAGKPNQQFLVCGGLYNSTNGCVNIVVIPYAGFCLVPKDNVFSRAEKVYFVKRVVVESPELMSDAAGNEFDESQVRICQKVPDDTRKLLLDLLRKYKHCFASSLKDLGCTNVAQMKIELNSQRPVVYRPYRLSHFERSQVRTMVDEMLDAGIVRESSSDYASPILLVRKKDGSLRMCIDYRMLNSVTLKERYPMPIIEDEIARLSGQACFISLDLASGYYQVPLVEQSKRFTSFVTPDGQYEFNRMPFGLANAPAVFQRMINTILGSARFCKATAYMDDILIFGRDSAECLKNFEDVLQLLEKANLTLNLSKCDFLRDKIDYLGYEIGVTGVRPGEKKISSVMNFPRPENVHNVRQFLGLASYFRKFVKDFALMAFPLSRLLKKGVPWEWGNNQETAFQDLKARLIDRPILAIFDPSAELELHTDASRIGIGGILLQRSADNMLRPVAYFSRQTSPEEKNFHSYELETLAVVCSLRKFRVYLLGKDFKIVTDCSALRSTFTKRDLIPRIARWWLQLQEFNCTIEYRAGIKMGHVDALSRNPVVESEENTSDNLPTVMAISSEDWLHTLQLGDSELRRIRDVLDSSLDQKGLQHIRENYVVKDNKLFRCVGEDKGDVRWVVPKGARWQLCRMNHDDIGHFGIEKTLERLKKSYWFPKMTRFVKKYVSACIECAYAKNNQSGKEGLLHPITKVEVPFHTLHIDHLGPFVKSKRGFSYLLVVVDAFTKFCFVKPVRNTHTQNVIRVLEDIFRIFRTPDRLVSDRGSCFTSHMFKRFCLDEGIKHILNAVSSPRSNGQVERYNRTILDSMKALSVKYGEKDWDCQLGKIQWGLNNTVQKTTGRTPAEVMFGTSMNVSANPILNEISDETRESTDLLAIRQEVKSRIDNEQTKQKRYYDKDRKPARQYAEGDLVKITKTCFNNEGQSKKLLPSYIGPYRVTKVLGTDRYAVAPIPGLAITQGKRATTVAADRMMPWIHVAALDVNEDTESASETDVD